MKSNIKAVIFDMDGVIADTELLNSMAWEKLLEERGIKPIFNNQGLVHEVGPVSDDVYRVIMERHGIKEEIDTIRKIRRKFFEELVKEKITPLPGFLELIKTLKKRKIRIAIASNRVIDHVYLVLDCLKVKKFFEVIQGPSPDLKRKPEPDIYLKTAEELRLKPNECIVLEDSETGILAGNKAGMEVIAVPNKYTKHHDFSKADKVVKSLSDITISMLNNL